MTVIQFLNAHPQLAQFVHGLIAHHMWGTLERLLALYRG